MLYRWFCLSFLKCSATRKTLQGNDQLQGKHLPVPLTDAPASNKEAAAWTWVFSIMSKKLCFLHHVKKSDKHSSNLKLLSNIIAPSAHDTWPQVTAWPRAVKFLWSALSRKSEESENKKRRTCFTIVLPSSMASIPWITYEHVLLDHWNCNNDLEEDEKGAGWKNEDIAKGTRDLGVACQSRIKSCTGPFSHITQTNNLASENAAPISIMSTSISPPTSSINVNIEQSSLCNFNIRRRVDFEVRPRCLTLGLWSFSPQILVHLVYKSGLRFLFLKVRKRPLGGPFLKFTEAFH